MLPENIGFICISCKNDHGLSWYCVVIYHIIFQDLVAQPSDEFYFKISITGQLTAYVFGIPYAYYKIKTDIIQSYSMEQ